MTGQGDVAGRLVETAARADFCRSHSADEGAWQRLSEESRDFYRDQTAERLADMLPLINPAHAVMQSGGVLVETPEYRILSARLTGEFRATQMVDWVSGCIGPQYSEIRYKWTKPMWSHRDDGFAHVLVTQRGWVVVRLGEWVLISQQKASDGYWYGYSLLVLPDSFVGLAFTPHPSAASLLRDLPVRVAR